MGEKTIKARDEGSRVFVSDYGDGEIWMNVSVRRASTAVVLGKQAVRELLAALQNIEATDDEPQLCSDCSGSGEGQSEGTFCRTCAGHGEVTA